MPTHSNQKLIWANSSSTYSPLESRGSLKINALDNKRGWNLGDDLSI